MVRPSWCTSELYSYSWPPMKNDPIRNVITIQKRSRTTSPFSAANTPSWQVTEERTRTVVLSVENGMFSSSGSVFQRPGYVDRVVKYIANSAAKNISSEESQTIVPTEVVFGRLAGTCVRALSTACAVATAVIIAAPAPAGTPTPRSVGNRRSTAAPPPAG